MLPLRYLLTGIATVNCDKCVALWQRSLVGDASSHVAALRNPPRSRTSLLELKLRRSCSQEDLVNCFRVRVRCKTSSFLSVIICCAGITIDHCLQDCHPVIGPKHRIYHLRFDPAYRCRIDRLRGVSASSHCACGLSDSRRFERE